MLAKKKISLLVIQSFKLSISPTPLSPLPRVYMYKYLFVSLHQNVISCEYISVKKKGKKKYSCFFKNLNISH